MKSYEQQVTAALSTPLLHAHCLEITNKQLFFISSFAAIATGYRA